MFEPSSVSVPGPSTVSTPVPVMPPESLSLAARILRKEPSDPPWGGVEESFRGRAEQAPPALIVVPPEYELSPDKVNAPVPISTNP